MKKYQWKPFVAATRSVGKYGWSEARLCPVVDGEEVKYVRERKSGINPVCSREGVRNARWLHEAAEVAASVLEGHGHPVDAIVAEGVLDAAANCARNVCVLRSRAERMGFIREVAHAALEVLLELGQATCHVNRARREAVE